MEGGGDLLSDNIKDRKSNRNSNMNFDTKQSAISGGKNPPNNTLSTNVHIVEYLDLSIVSLSLSLSHTHTRTHAYTRMIITKKVFVSTKTSKQKLFSGSYDN